jgi:hypothetical protein
MKQAAHLQWIAVRWTNEVLVLWSVAAQHTLIEWRRLWQALASRKDASSALFSGPGGLLSSL